jgi:hypothetical protein
MEADSSYDVVIYGASPAGIACAVRAARSGLSCLLVSHTAVLGGMLSNGLCVWDTLYEGFRAPLYNEIREGIIDYYRQTYGEDSEQYRHCLPRSGGHYNGNFEARVARRIITACVNAEPGVTSLFLHYPVRSDIDERTIRKLVFRHMERDEEVTAAGDTFVDASYEGDLLAVAGCDFSVGRESREEYAEPHAGRIFMRTDPTAADDRSEALATVHDNLNLRCLPGHQVELSGPGSGEADRNVQMYNYRLSLTDDPENRLPITVPDGYDPSHVSGWESNWDMPRFPEQYDIPNRKAWVNRPQLSELQSDYPLAGWDERRRIMDTHWHALLEYLYFLSHDQSVPHETREIMSRVGLPKDDYPENGHRPWEIYVREARRLKGRYVFTEHDVILNEETNHTPFHSDAVSATDWYRDLHASSSERYEDSGLEGSVKLWDESFPAQIPFRSLLPLNLDNLMVICCVSASHVGFGAVRLEPTWMAVGESAGVAAVVARREGCPVAEVSRELLLKEIVEQRIMVSFLNDLEPGCAEPWTPAVQYFGVKGFFTGYNARPLDPVDSKTATLWIEGARCIRAGFTSDAEADAFATELASQLKAIDKGLTPPLVNSALAAVCCEAGLPDSLSNGITASPVAVTRGRFCHVLFSWIFMNSQ